MSIQAVAWVLDRSEASGSHRLVLIAIANHIGPTGWAWPSIPSIARESKVDERTVYRCMKTLEELGELTIERRPGKGSRYGLTALIQTVSPLTECHPSTTASPLTPRQGTPDTGVTRTIKNHQKTNARTPAHARPAHDWNTPLPTNISEDERKRGAEFMRNLRQKAEPT